MCVLARSDAKIALEENRRRAEFSNPLRASVDVGRVDGCLINDGRSRCDYYVRKKECIWLVERKGRDVRKAVDQIVETTLHLEDHIEAREIIPVIVTSCCPAIAAKAKDLAGLKRCKGKLSGTIVLRTRIAKIQL